MRGKSINEDCEKTKTLTSSITQTPPRKRGRPKGAKNKPKGLIEVSVAVADKPRRGRPKGAKNKPKIIQENVAIATAPKRRGRPPKTLVQPITVQEKQQTHPIFPLLDWLQENMHPSQVQYYRGRASRGDTTLQQAIAADILGFFNVKETEELKQIKKNNFIASVSNELHY